MPMFKKEKNTGKNTVLENERLSWQNCTLFTHWLDNIMKALDQYDKMDRYKSPGRKKITRELRNILKDRTTPPALENEFAFAVLVRDYFLKHPVDQYGLFEFLGEDYSKESFIYKLRKEALSTYDFASFQTNQNELVIQKQAHERFAKERKEFEKEIAALNKQLREQQKASKNELEELNQQITHWHQLYLQLYFSDRELEIRKLEKTIEDLNKNITNLKDELKSSQEKIKELHDQPQLLATLQEKNKCFNAALSEQAEIMDHLKNQLEQKTQLVNQLEPETIELKKQIDHLSSKVQDLTPKGEENDKLQSELKKLSAELESYKLFTDKQSNHIKDLVEKQEVLEKQLVSTKNELTQLQNERLEFKKEIEKEKNKAKKEIEKEREDFKKEQQAYAEEVKQFKDVIVALSRFLRRLFNMDIGGLSNIKGTHSTFNFEVSDAEATAIKTVVSPNFKIPNEYRKPTSEEIAVFVQKNPTKKKKPSIVPISSVTPKEPTNSFKEEVAVVLPVPPKEQNSFTLFKNPAPAKETAKPTNELATVTDASVPTSSLKEKVSMFFFSKKPASNSIDTPVVLSETAKKQEETYPYQPKSPGNVSEQ